MSCLLSTVFSCRSTSSSASFDTSRRASRVATFLSSSSAPAHVIAAFETYTGLHHGDPGFVAASAAIGAQTGLSTFFCLASFVLILFIAPPSRFFAS